jgi:hypothetical protein
MRRLEAVEQVPEDARRTANRENGMARNPTTFKRGHKAMGGRPKGSLNRTTLEVREFARHLIEDPEYQASLRHRMIAGKAPQMEMVLFHYAYGKPVERHELTASATAAGPEGSERRASEAAEEDPSRRCWRSRVDELTPEGRERLRKALSAVIGHFNKEGTKRAPLVSCLPRRHHQTCLLNRRRPIFVQFFYWTTLGGPRRCRLRLSGLADRQEWSSIHVAEDGLKGRG